MSLAQALSEAVAFQVKFHSRDDTELREGKAARWAAVEIEIEKLVDDRARNLTRSLKPKKRK